MILHFQIGPCSVLIYIGEHQTETKDDELNAIVEKFKQKNKAIYVSEMLLLFLFEMKNELFIQ